MSKFIVLIIILFSFLNSSDLSIQKIKNKDNSIDIYFLNPNNYHVTMKYVAETKNIKTSKKLPIVEVLQPKSKTKLLTLFPLSNNIYFKANYYWILGDKNAIHNNNYLYRLPFKIGETHKISQGFNGKFSHTGDSQYAVDFDLKVGSKIYAARDGEVVDIKYDSNKGGKTKNYIDKANYITIKHSDNTYATYAHLKQNGVLVSIGQKIKRGELIGFSGNTGYSTAPHLHFVVFKPKNSKHRITFPIKFKTANGILTNSITGTKVTAVK